MFTQWLTQTFQTVLFVRVKTYAWDKCLTIDEWEKSCGTPIDWNNIEFNNKNEYATNTGITDMKICILSKRTSSVNSICNRIPFIYDSRKSGTRLQG